MSTSLDVAVAEDIFLLTLHRLELTKVWDWVQENNPTGNLPYHNNQHMFHVARLAHQCYTTSEFSNDVCKQLVIVAALMHDFDHSGGECSDAINIENAINGFRKLVSELSPSYDRNSWINRFESQQSIESLIRSTVFPNPSACNNTMEAALRDADMLYSLTENTGEIIIDGLRKEAEVAKGHAITREEMLEQQRSFLPSVTLHTMLGKFLWKNHVDHVLAAQQRYVEQCG